MPSSRIGWWVVVPWVLLGSACLDPLSSDEVDPSLFLGPPNTPIEQLPHVEDNPELARNVELFGTSIAYLSGYADGEKIWYWNVEGLNATHIAPMFIIVDADGESNPSTPIVDVLPGDPGYSPWWRRIKVRRTELYQGEGIWSREAVEAAIQAGLLSEPEPTPLVANCPVMLRGTEFDLGEGQVGGTRTALYRGQRLDWAVFDNIEVLPVDEREMPSFPVYVVQRIDEAAPIYEFLTGVDFNGDEKLNASNNIFASKLDGPRYSPHWFLGVVRVPSDYPSLDRGADPVLKAEAQLFLDPDRTTTSTSVVSVSYDEEFQINCPIQRTRGEL